MTGDVSGWLRETWDRVVGSDPGLNRLRLALASAVAMSSTLGVEFLFAQATHAGATGTLVAMLLGTVMAMMGSMALTGVGLWTKVRTAVFFPVAVGLGMLGGVLVAGHTDLTLGMFVAVMFLAVLVRRFGLAFFFYGFMTWMGYFFAAFLGARLTAVPGLLAAVTVASAWVLLLSVTVLRTSARRTLRRNRRAFLARAGAVARACADLLAADRPEARQRERARRRLHARQLRLAETALVIESWSAEEGALPPEWSAPALRRHLLDAQLALDALATAADALATTDGPDTSAAGRIVGHLARRDHPAAERAARRLLATLEEAAPRTGRGWWPAHHLATAALDFVALVGRAGTPPDADGVADFEPTVALAMGDLPGSAAVAGDVEARGGRWNPLRRVSLTTRQAIQVAIAGTAAILAGRALSEDRYYWAVIAAFIAFTGTATRSETFLKAVNRVLGTVLGLGAGVGLAHLTAGRIGWVLVVIVLSMSIGFYLVRLSYAAMIFFVTVMVAQLYSVLHMFSAGLLVLRVEETAVGAAVGIVVALVVLPTSTRDTVRAAWGNYFTALAELLREAVRRLDPTPYAADAGPDRDPDRAARPDHGPDVGDADAAGGPADLDALIRAVDNRLQQLALVSRPLVRPLVWGNDPRRVRHQLVLCAATAAQARALAAGLRHRPLAGADELAAVCRALADAVTGLAGTSTPGGSAFDEPLAAAQGVLLLRLPEPGPAVPTALAWPLVHLCQLLQELAHPGAAPARRMAPDGPASGADSPDRPSAASGGVAPCRLGAVARGQSTRPTPP